MLSIVASSFCICFCLFLSLRQHLHTIYLFVLLYFFFNFFIILVPFELPQKPPQQHVPDADSVVPSSSLVSHILKQLQKVKTSTLSTQQSIGLSGDKVQFSFGPDLESDQKQSHS